VLHLSCIITLLPPSLCPTQHSPSAICDTCVTPNTTSNNAHSTNIPSHHDHHMASASPFLAKPESYNISIKQSLYSSSSYPHNSLLPLPPCATIHIPSSSTSSFSNPVSSSPKAQKTTVGPGCRNVTTVREALDVTLIARVFAISAWRMGKVVGSVEV
jgi:hypothetical protein